MADPMGDRMRKAYEAGRLLLKAGATRSGGGEPDPGDLDALEDIPDDLILCVAGQYDRVETVLDVLGVQYRVVEGPALTGLALRPEQIVFVNCPGSGIPPAGLRRLAAFVQSGGTLVTTDWALKYVIEPAFPGVLAYNGLSTCGGPNECVRIRVADPEDPVVQGLTDTGEDPVWWLEPSSFPVRVLDPERVQVLIDSDEMAARYNDRPILVRFSAGAGVVYHMVSHYYLQRAETRTKRAQASAATYLTQAGLSPEEAKSYADLKVGEVEAAFASSRVIGNLVIEARRRNRSSTRWERGAGGSGSIDRLPRN